MHNARQRAILSTLGIRQWVPRAIATTAAPASHAQLWRQSGDQPGDQFVNQTGNQPGPQSGPQLSHHQPGSEQVITTHSLSTGSVSNQAQPEPIFSSELISKPDTAIISTKPDSQRTQVIAPAGLQSDRVALSIDITQTGQAIPATPVAASATNTVVQNADDFEQEVATPANLLNFRLQACEINQWIVLVNESDLQNPQLHKLWQNILLAFKKPAITYFSWPLSDGQRWHRMTGSQAALNGFLFRMGLDKRVGLMSDLADEVCPDRIERLPHLTELMEQPLKKRLLWQLLKSR